MKPKISPNVAEGTLIAIPLPWEHCASGCVEWQLVDWTLPDGNGERLPILFDGAETGAWDDDYAIRGPQDDMWRFPDGERRSDEDLLAAFRRRNPPQEKRPGQLQ